MEVISEFSGDAKDKFVTWPGLGGSTGQWVLCCSPGGK